MLLSLWIRTFKYIVQIQQSRYLHDKIEQSNFKHEECKSKRPEMIIVKEKIWILNHYAGDMFFNKGGRHYSIAKYLKRMEYEPTVFACNAKHNSQSELFFNKDILWSEHCAEEIDVSFVFVKGRAYTGNGKQRILNMIDFYRNVKAAAREYAKYHGKPDIIYASSVHPLTVVAGIQLAKKFGVPCICEIRDLWPESLVAYGIVGPHNPAVLLLRRMEKWIYKKSDVIVFTMEGAYDYIIEQGWEKEISRNKVFYINNGIDLEQFKYNLENYTIHDEDLQNNDLYKIVYVGSIRRANNLSAILDVAKKIKNPNIKFLIWGNGDELSALIERVKNEHINNVVFKGRVDKKYIPYITSKANLNYSHVRSNPIFMYGISFNKIFDYLAAEKPILCGFSSNYNPALMGGAGIAVTSADPEDIAESVEKFASLDEKTYEKYCIAAKETAKEYDFRYLTDKIMDAIHYAQKNWNVQT